MRRVLRSRRSRSVERLPKRRQLGHPGAASRVRVDAAGQRRGRLRRLKRVAAIKAKRGGADKRSLLGLLLGADDSGAKLRAGEPYVGQCLSEQRDSGRLVRTIRYDEQFNLHLDIMSASEPALHYLLRGPMSLAGDALGRVDEAVGDGIEAVQRAHHRRRLRRLGHAAALAPQQESGLWVTSGRPPSAGNSLEVLVDGLRALAEIERALLSARSHVHIAGWHLEPNFCLTGDHGLTVREILTELAERLEVRVLLWAGPPVPAFKPTRKMVRAVRDELTTGTKIRCVLDSRERTMHCHHEKLVIVDDEVAFVGGIDLTSLSGDRWDTPRHEPRQSIGWHDVATKLRGPVVAEAAQHFRQRWQEVAKERLPAPVVPAPAGDVEIQLLRTIPERTYGFAARGEFGILEGYLRALRSAQSFIYLENQFLWSTEIARVLMDKLRNPPSDLFRILLMLPARPNDGADTTRGQLGALIEADNHGGRLLPVTINSYAVGQTSPLYVHAKVGIVDDKWLTVGSANLNEHSLFNDTEINVATCDPALARGTRLELWSEHLVRPVEEIEGDPAALIDALWRPIAEEQLARRKAGIAQTHRLMQLAAVSRRSKRLVGPLKGLLVDG